MDITMMLPEQIFPYKFLYVTLNFVFITPHHLLIKTPALKWSGLGFTIKINDPNGARLNT